MIWLNPWAWLGLVAVALPIAIHLLGRGHARVFRFPTLRFIDASRLLPTKRSRLQDPLLLAVRVAIVAIAALALAQPLLLTARRRRALDRGLARVVVVDTSAATGNARTWLDSSRAIGRRLAAEAQTSIVVETVGPANALAGASAWLTRQERRGEIVIVSDFRRGEIDRADFVSVPPAFGIVLRRAGAVVDSSATVSTRMAVGGARVIEARAAPQTNGSDVEWRSASDSSIRAPVTLLAAPGDAAAVAALQAAAATIAVPLPIDATRTIAILFSSRADRSAIIAKLEPARIGWQIALLAAARRDGLPIGRAGTTTIDGTKRFVIATEAPVSSVAAARLVGLARQTTSAAPTSSELDPETLSDRELSAWERPATEPVSTQHRPTDENAPSDARWLWAIVLGLLLVEWRLRRPRAVAAMTGEARARAA